MPKITSKTYDILIEEFKNFYNSTTPLIILPEYNGKTGNPVILSNHFFSELKEISGDIGAKYLIKKNEEFIKKVKISESYILEDIDDLEKYKELIKDEK
jgi:molybdenum cofactor cytidylyltransferase